MNNKCLYIYKEYINMEYNQNFFKNLERDSLNFNES